MFKTKSLLILLSVIFLASIGYVGYAIVKDHGVNDAPVGVEHSVDVDGEANSQDSLHDKQLETLFSQWLTDKPGEYRMYVRELTGGKRWAGYRADEKIIAASTYKLFLTYIVLEEAEKNGSFNLDSPLGSGNVRSCIESLLVVSSDACAFSLGNIVGWSALDARLRAVGFINTALHNYTETGDTVGNKYTTAYDEALLLQRLAEGTLLNQQHSELMLGFMKRQVHRERIAAGLPRGAVVASKPGWIYEIENDAGIVYGPTSTYVIVVLSDRSEPSVLAGLSSLVYNYLQE